MFKFWHLHRSAVVVGGALVAGVLVLVAVLVLVLRSSTPNAAHEAAPSNAQSTSPGSAVSTTEPTAPATDVRSWNAIPPVVPAVSSGLPAIGAPANSDPDAFARSFVTELFTRNYATQTRQQLIAWAQYEDAPLQSPNYPRADWSKVLVDSLTDLTWDSATDTPIPAVGPWLALRSERAHQTVSDVKVSLNSQWEQQIAGGYLSPFQNTTSALLWSSYNGEEQGNALADVLLGKVDPSGRLPFSWYANESQIPAITDYAIRPTASTDGRTYQYFTGDLSYPFGYGMSYDKFRYSDISINRNAVSANGTITVTARVKNEGTTVGSQVPQLYVTTPFEPASAQRPIKRLEGFQKVTLNPGQAKTVTFKVKASALAFFDETSNKYVVDPGRYGLQVSTSSADSDIQLTASVKVTGAISETPTVLTAKPIETGDIANNVAQRVMFDINTTIDPQLTVSMNDQRLYGYVTKGQSTPLPAGLTVSYSSDRTKVVKVSKHDTLKAVGSGIATVTATVRYHGGTASTSFTVDVAPLQITSNPSTVIQVGTQGSFTVTTNSSPTARLTENGTLGIRIG